jgi:tRNA dimethylallyltransferase
MTTGRPLLVILGPTASGKSALGILLAARFAGEILACDSTQVYRHFDIGTGKGRPGEQRGIPQHLVDLVAPEEEFTAGDYRQRARSILAQVTARGRLPIVTAGTGLYLRALLEGLSPLPPSSPELRTRLVQSAGERGGAYLHRMLARLDAPSARAIAPRDVAKIVRALEIYFQARQPRSELFAAGRDRLQGYDVTKVGLMPSRPELYTRIEQRVEHMLAAGWLDEVRRLLQRFPPTAKPFGFLGYRQLVAHVRGELTLKEAVKKIKHETRQFAKRQMTWFRKEPDVRWFPGFGDDPAIQRDLFAYLGKLRPAEQANFPL